MSLLSASMRSRKLRNKIWSPVYCCGAGSKRFHLDQGSEDDR